MIQIFWVKDRTIQGHNPPLELVEEIRNVIISEAHKYVKRHKIKKEIASIDKPKHTNIDIYAGLDQRNTQGYFNIDNYFTEVR